MSFYFIRHLRYSSSSCTDVLMIVITKESICSCFCSWARIILDEKLRQTAAFCLPAAPCLDTGLAPFLTVHPRKGGFSVETHIQSAQELHRLRINDLLEKQSIKTYTFILHYRGGTDLSSKQSNTSWPLQSGGVSSFSCKYHQAPAFAEATPRLHCRAQDMNWRYH